MSTTGYSAVPGSAREVADLRAAVVALAEENAALWSVLVQLADGSLPELDRAEFARQCAAERPEVKRIRQQQAPGRDIDQFVDHLRTQQAANKGFDAPPFDAHSDERAAREAAYARLWPDGSDHDRLEGER